MYSLGMSGAPESLRGSKKTSLGTAMPSNSGCCYTDRTSCDLRDMNRRKVCCRHALHARIGLQALDALHPLLRASAVPSQSKAHAKQIIRTSQRPYNVSQASRS